MNLALFDPVGVRGLLYWYGLWGVHQMVFAGMQRNIVRAARTESGSAGTKALSRRRPAA